MEIVNSELEDYHIHSINFSDGMNTIDEIVKFAGEIGLKKIAITDHSQTYLDERSFNKKTYYNIINRWENVFNNVEVSFGVEADILNAEGDVCMDIQGIVPEIILLSSHPSPPFQCHPSSITEAYLNAIERHHDKISFLAHPCSKYYEDYINIDAVVEACNKYNLPMEFNCANLVNSRTNLNNLSVMLEKADRIYINSDSHTLKELRDVRKAGFDYLKENGYIK